MDKNAHIQFFFFFVGHVASFFILFFFLFSFLDFFFSFFDFLACGCDSFVLFCLTGHDKSNDEPKQPRSSRSEIRCSSTSLSIT